MRRLWPAAILGLLILAPVLALAGTKDAEINEGKIYYGDSSSFTKAGVIRISTVFGKIPEYREAQRKGKDDPEYFILVEKANQKFQLALQSAAGAHGYDLIGEVGAIKIKGETVPNITDLVVEALPE